MMPYRKALFPVKSLTWNEMCLCGCACPCVCVRVWISHRWTGDDVTFTRAFTSLHGNTACGMMLVISQNKSKRPVGVFFFSLCVCVWGAGVYPISLMGYSQCVQCFFTNGIKNECCHHPLKFLGNAFHAFPRTLYFILSLHNPVYCDLWACLLRWLFFIWYGDDGVAV